MNLDKLSFFRIVNQINTRVGSSANHKGFTLIELIVVVAIIAVLALMAIPAYNEYINKTKNASAISDIRTLSTEISAYYMDRGSYPSGLDKINRDGFQDPWKNAYEYNPVPTLMDTINAKTLNTDYDIYSKGKGHDGTSTGGDPANDDDIVRANDGNYVGLRP
jgi:general secretion pathway protein G